MARETPTATTLIESLPPSCACIYKTLEHEGPLSRSELIEQSRLPERTAGDALARLSEVEIIAAESPIDDLRRTEYRLDDSAEV